MTNFDKNYTLRWFTSLSDYDKAHVIVLFAHQLTIVIRSIYLDYDGDHQMSSRLAYVISELNHRLLSGASELMTHNRSFSDDTLVDMMIEAPRRELISYFPFVMQQVMKIKSGI